MFAHIGDGQVSFRRLTICKLLFFKPKLEDKASVTNFAAKFFLSLQRSIFAMHSCLIAVAIQLTLDGFIK